MPAKPAGGSLHRSSAATHVLPSPVPAMTEPSADLAAHREWLIGRTAHVARGTIVDLGCGRGGDLRLLAERHRSADVRLVGLDVSADAVATAEQALAGDPRIYVRRASLEGRLPLDDASVDLAYSHNVVECLASADDFAREVVRVLRPGGQVVVGHWDWDTQIFDGRDKALVRRLVAAYADWQQAWMAHADGWMGRRLRGIFDATGALDGEVQARVLLNTTFSPGHFGYENAQALGALVRRGLASPTEWARFLQEQEDLAREGRYVYGITGFAYVGRRRAGERVAAADGAAHASSHPKAPPTLPRS